MKAPTKFVLLGHPRSGSTLVTTSLQQHPDVRMFGELFHAEFANRLIAYQWGIECRPSTLMSRRRTAAWAYTDHQDGEQFLDDLVFNDRSEDAPLAIGFKFFYDHASAPRAAKAWDYLRAHPEVRLVHLIRTNLLDCLISTLTAEMTRVWEVETDADDAVPESTTLTISPVDCEAYFRRLTHLREHAVDLLSTDGREVLTIEYEKDVNSDLQRTLLTVQQFLGVPTRTLRPRLRKLSSRPAEARLLNFAQLEQHFRSTPFHWFFEGNGAACAIRG